MKLFIDTAEIDEIRQAASWGVLDGVTTNPSLVAKSGRRREDVIREICEIVNGPVSAEVVETQAGKMLEEGLRLAEIHPNVVVKCPMTPDGLQATRALSERSVRVNVTLVFQAAQALLAAKAGAAFISPFVGRLDDVGEDGMALIASIMKILGNYSFRAELLVASVRHPVHVVRAAELGAHVATLPFVVLQQIVKHPLTDIGLERFLADYRKATGK